MRMSPSRSDVIPVVPDAREGAIPANAGLQVSKLMLTINVAAMLRRIWIGSFFMKVLLSCGCMVKSPGVPT
jgi:hypothetical protein